MTLILPKFKQQYEQLAENIDYVLVPNEANALTVRLMREPFVGVVIFYGRVKVYEQQKAVITEELSKGAILGDKYELVQDQDMQGVLQFHYEVLENPTEVLTQHFTEFEWLVGKVLETILEDAIADNSKYDVFVYNEDGTSISGLKPLQKGSFTGFTPPNLWTRIKNWFKGEDRT